MQNQTVAKAQSTEKFQISDTVKKLLKNTEDSIEDRPTEFNQTDQFYSEVFGRTY